MSNIENCNLVIYAVSKLCYIDKFLEEAMDDNVLVFSDGPCTEHLIIPIIDFSDHLNAIEFELIDTMMNDMCEQIMEINDSLWASKYTIVPIAFGNEAKVVELMAKYKSVYSELRFFVECKLDFALETLNQILQLKKDGGNLNHQLNGMPIIMFVLGSNYSEKVRFDAISKLKNNYWFNFALRFAITFDNSENSVLKDFLTSNEYIIKAEDIVTGCNLSNIFNGILLSPDENSGFALMSNYSCAGDMVEHSAKTDEKFKLAVMDNIRKSLTFTGIGDLL